MSNDLSAIKKLVSDVRDTWDESTASMTKNHTELRVALDHAYRPAWDLKLQRVALVDLPADKPMINGPLFTSGKHPWPAEEGLLAVPIVQLDLAILGALYGIDLGKGLVQLWHGEKRLTARVIATEDLSPFAAAITPLMPGEAMAAYHFELGAYGLPSFVSNPHRIIGYHGPYLFGPMEHDEALNQMIAAQSTSKVLQAQLKRLRKTVLSGRKQFAQNNRIFGSFDALHVAPEDLPPTLFSSIDENLLNTGDAGIITLHYSKLDEQIIFSGYLQSY
ncbi:hypothetical protein GGR44_002525 [Sphingobium fontiphilum]|uniref:DUF1963 domain-containing protein n=1 Tax=Sphingobium fontiphilum TaxID=944425 RepID=A0A7W6DLH9_9SPHN|nr:hypothetical protein [Sphingobium fontiphilum]MBB3982845.1 hypothetical protein [Sphingobium fontiphilum]